MPFNAAVASVAVAGLLFGGVDVAEAPALMRITLCSGGFVDVPFDRKQERRRDDCAGLSCHATTERRRKGDG